VRTAGVTRGALYHHFTDKKDLFRAVLDRVQADVAGQIQAAVEKHTDPWQQLVAGCHAFLAAATDPDRQQIMLIDGPSVLGWAEWRAIDARHSLRALTEGLGELVDLGLIQPHPVEPMALALSGAMNETALWVAGARRREQALRDAIAVIDTLLAALPSR
jgi:AcrR family transcriptional regulator